MARPKNIVEHVQRMLSISKPADGALMLLRERMSKAEGRNVPLGEVASRAIIEYNKGGNK